RWRVAHRGDRRPPRSSLVRPLRAVVAAPPLPPRGGRRARRRRRVRHPPRDRPAGRPSLTRAGCDLLLHRSSSDARTRRGGTGPPCPRVLASSCTKADNRRVLEMNEPQVWVLIGVFAAALFGMLTIVSTLFLRVVRSEI